MERRKFTREFKLEAVRLIKERGVSYAQASHDLSVHQSQLRSWVKALANDPQHAFSSYAGFWVTRRSGGVVCRQFDDLDAIFKFDTCDDLRQLICAFQPPPGLRCGAEQLEHHQLGSG